MPEIYSENHALVRASNKCHPSVFVGEKFFLMITFLKFVVINITHVERKLPKPNVQLSELL